MKQECALLLGIGKPLGIARLRIKWLKRKPGTSGVRALQNDAPDDAPELFVWKTVAEEHSLKRR
jgi:hypothetical protein